MSLYREAIHALKQVLLLEERLRNAALDIAAISREIADLRDRVSRLEGMLSSGSVQRMPKARPPRRPSLAAPKSDDG